MRVELNGAFDLHLHTGPCLFPRIADDLEVARVAREYKMAGIMLKCHHESSVSRAALAAAAVPDIRVFGGIVLNTYVGGLNPAAVELTLRRGGRGVWFSTVDARMHVEVHGAPGLYAKNGQAPRFMHDGITVLDENDKLKEDVKIIMELVKDYDAFLGSAHCSPKECFVLADFAQEIGFKKLLINHAHYRVPNLDIPTQQQLIAKGALIEYGYCTVSPGWAANTVDQAVKAIQANGAENCIIVSDAGQLNNPIPPESLRVFAQCLHDKGISPEQLNLLMVENPKRLLGI